VIRLTDEWTKSAAARAVPGSAWDADEKAWVLHAPTPRAAAVALKLFPGLEHEYPELVELRAVLVRDAKPVDYATKLRPAHRRGPRVRAALAERGWSFEHANVTPLGAGEDYQSIDLGYLAEVLRKHGGGYLGWARGLGKTLGTAALIDELDCKTASSSRRTPPSRRRGPASWAGRCRTRGHRAAQRQGQARALPADVKTAATSASRSCWSSTTRRWP
jgi:hypothetical protein